MAKIKSPAEGFTGRTYIGPLILDFKDGVADYDGDLPDGVKRYLQQNGYGLGSKAPTAPESEFPEPPDPRDYAEPTQVGSKLRDAAVDPHEDDFLAPTNAGKANPHGSEVISPEIHASQGVRPVKGGEVHVDDPEAQDAAETEHAEDATSGEPITEPEPEPLKGAALDEALEAAGLPKSGTADEKRARLAEHQA